MNGWFAVELLRVNSAGKNGYSMHEYDRGAENAK
jgi:hypothetical protein